MGSAAVNLFVFVVAAFVSVVGVFRFSDELKLFVSFEDDGPIGVVVA